MKIAIDIDNTIFSCDSLLYKYVSNLFVKQKTEKKLSYIEFDSIKPIVYQEGLRLFSKIHNSDYYNQVDNSVTVINLLKSEGHEIFILSARPKDKFSRNVIFNLVNKYGLKFDILALNCKNKVNYCKEREIDVMVDDQYKICQACVNVGINAIWLTDKNKKTENNSNLLYVANNWNEIDDIILNELQEDMHK